MANKLSIKSAATPLMVGTNRVGTTRCAVRAESSGGANRKSPASYSFQSIVYSLSAIFVLCLLLAGCAAGPNYKMPKTDVAPTFSEASQTNLQNNLTTNETSVTWWQAFNDAELNSLVERSLASNHDLRIATANVLQARALHRQAQFDLLP